MSGAANGNGTARWQLWVSIGTAAIAVFGSIMVLYWTSMTAYNNTQDQARRLDRLEAAFQAHQLAVARLEEHQVEIETQLRANDQVRNLNRAQDARIEAMLWEKAFQGKSHLPTDNAFYPEIAAPPRR